MQTIIFTVLSVAFAVSYKRLIIYYLLFIIYYLLFIIYYYYNTGHSETSNIHVVHIQLIIHWLGGSKEYLVLPISGPSQTLPLSKQLVFNLSPSPVSTMLFRLLD